MSRWMMPSSLGPLQGGGDLHMMLQAERQFGRPFLLDELAQVAALDVLQGHVVDAVGLADGVDLHDVGVGGAGDRLGLGLEALQRACRWRPAPGVRNLRATLRLSEICSAR